jgi:hypothetical protein
MNQDCQNLIKFIFAVYNEFNYQNVVYFSLYFSFAYPENLESVFDKSRFA